tara:strand:+ start:735 stop:2075 length:1341 start_codon:yes stop_codon:yes gene_type:complete
MSTESTTATKFVFEKVGYKPTEAQEPIVYSDKRFVLVAGGEQAGKSLVASKFLLSKWTETKGPALFWLVAADYERSRAEFMYLVDDFATLGILKKASKRVDPGRIELADGTVIETKSAKDPRTLAMRAPDGIIGCEASQLDLETFYRLRGRCAPKKAWMFLGGTFEGSLGWYPQLFLAWQHGTDVEKAYSLPSYTNIHFYPGGEDDPEIKRLEKDSSDDFFKERIMGIPSPPRGLVFHEFRADYHVREVEYIPNEPVHLWIDPGYAGGYAVEVVQIIDDQICVVDEIYEKSLITEEIVDMAMDKPWWKDVRFGVIDVAGYQHQAMSAPAEVWLDKAGLYMASQKVKINDGTERLKSMLKVDPKHHRPKLVVNPKCVGLLSEFGAAPNPFDGQTRVYKWKTDRDGNIVGNQPEDKYNHGIKALIYGLIDRFGYSHIENMDRIKVKRW